jgi:arylsulfatase A-like enzyme
MDKLKAIGESDNTLVVFSADHGDMLESHDAVLPKQYPHDYSNHIPFMAKFPEKLKKGVETDLLMSTLDIMPTTLGLLGIGTDQDYDGKDLSKSIISNNQNKVGYLPIWNYKKGNGVNVGWRGVVTKEYTFSMGIETNSPLANVLFNRKNDPSQLNNLYNNPEYSEVQKNLEALTYSWMEKYNDKSYSSKDFARIEPKGGWANNRKYSAHELFEAEQKEYSKNN